MHVKPRTRTDLSTEHATTDRRVGHDGASELPASLHKANLIALDVEGERGVLDLNGIDMLDLAGSTEGFTAAFGQADILDLALLLELFQLLHRLLDRRLLAQPMNVVEINEREAQTPQGALTRGTTILGRAVHRAVALGIDFVCELGGEEYIVSLSRIRLEPFT